MPKSIHQLPESGKDASGALRRELILLRLKALKALEDEQLVQHEDLAEPRTSLVLEYIATFREVRPLPHAPPEGSVSLNGTPYPPKVVICYSHADDEYENAHWVHHLEEHLGLLKKQGSISVWSDQKLAMGVDWHSNIQKELTTARVAILLVGPSFLCSEYIRTSELPVLLTKARKEGAVIISVIVRPCQFDKAIFKYPDPEHGPDAMPLSTFQAAHDPSEPLSGLSGSQRDQVLKELADRVLQIVETPE